MLIDIAVQTTRIVLITFILLGTIGNILNLFIFTRQTLLKSSCTLYLIAQSIDNLFVIYTSLLTRLLADGFSMDITLMSNTLCKLRYYFAYIFLAVSPYFSVLACFDRYWSSSASATRRSLCNKKLAKRLILGAIVLACILYSHIAMFFEIISTDCLPKCYAALGPYSIFFRIFYLIIYCILPSVCMGVLCLLTVNNVRQQSKRVRPVSIAKHEDPHRVDLHLIRMLFAQIMTQLVCILPYATFILVTSFIQIDITLSEFLNPIFILPLYVSYATSFYVFTLSSRFYRMALLKLVWSQKFSRDRIHVVRMGMKVITRTSFTNRT